MAAPHLTEANHDALAGGGIAVTDDWSRIHCHETVTCLLLVAIALVSNAYAQRVTQDIAYATAHARQVLDVYARDGAKNLPVVFEFTVAAGRRGTRA